MKSSGPLVLFFTFQVVLLFGYITKEVALVRGSYRVQRCEKRVAEFKEEKNIKTAELHSLQNRSELWNYAKNELGMQKMESKQLHESI